jgi:hypothetical protein
MVAYGTNNTFALSRPIDGGFVRKIKKINLKKAKRDREKLAKAVQDRWGYHTVHKKDSHRSLAAEGRH